MESLLIKNFGPLKAFEMWDIGRLNVMVGKSGSGKSTALKLLSVCQWIYKMVCIRSYLHYSGIKRSPIRFNINQLLVNSGLGASIQGSTEFTYSNGNFTLSYKNKKASFEKKLIPESELSLEKVVFISDKRSVIADLMEGNLQIRHGMYYLNDTISNFRQAVDAISSTELPYLNLKMETRRTTNGSRLFALPASGGNYAIPANQTSSGAQSALAVHYIVEFFSKHYDLIPAVNSMVLKYLTNTDSLEDFRPSRNIGSFGHKRINITIEEPESNLFPENQGRFMEFLTDRCYHGSRNDVGINLSIATHSPYILQSINTMLLAGKAAEKDSRRVAEIMNGDYTLNFKDVRAWQIKDGYAESILDAGIEMIDFDYIDEITDEVDSRITQLNHIIYG